ncbi:hypothetical protein HRM2_39290 [Desulforapulum autotrophicum HRM2]|uniref:Uncharacterized protein n=1 Tax=Desulforapulum autotrophicum (strain ATCC 43914 / DSM 3382 / VKM B-1955 / HRM2) TaxID=177437 RepID=C0QBI5_DESAH|nr:hypothetical protein [Desulforapulum autotrophicum]ACN16987.1 hypothetical protein HRM2_39290 [Desulforapulum autotrophicum HRM2]
MSMTNLNEKRFQAAKEKIHLELVNYFTRLNCEQRVWDFMTSIRFQAQGRYFTHLQAKRLISYLSRHYGIRRANINTALAFKAFSDIRDKKNAKILRLKRDCIPDEEFEQQMCELEDLRLEKHLEYWQALELTVLILDHYPGCIKNLTT